MSEDETLGDLNISEQDILNLIKELGEISEEIMPVVMMTIGCIYKISPTEFFKRLGNTVVKEIESHPGIDKDHTAQALLGMLKSEIMNLDNKDSNIGYL